jgi:hypothetical protein
VESAFTPALSTGIWAPALSVEYASPKKTAAATATA